MGARTQDELVTARQTDWHELDRALGDRQAKDGPAISRTAALYRALCSDLMRARSLGCTPELMAYLDGLAARAHASLYGTRPLRVGAIVELFTRDFPRAVRRNWRALAIAGALFWLPFFAGMIGAALSADFARRILPGATLEHMERMYSDGFAAGRDAGTDTGMAGFYVYNNVGIAFRCFATGILFGAGSLFFLVYNGLVTGTVLGYVIHAGYGANILTFVCGHSAFELGAIVVAGSAGLQMGFAMVSTGGLTRLGSLRTAAPEIVRQVLGAAAMLLCAALIEGFWSPSSAPPPIKWTVAGTFALLLGLYFTLAGRAARRA